MPRTGAWGKNEDLSLFSAVYRFLQERNEWGNYLESNILPCCFSWTQISKEVDSRNSKQCRERWVNQLSPTINNGPWTEEEDSCLLLLFKDYPRQWCQIARHLNRRTQNQVKSRWRKLQRIENYQRKIITKAAQEEEFFMAEIAHLLVSN